MHTLKCVSALAASLFLMESDAKHLLPQHMTGQPFSKAFESESIQEIDESESKNAADSSESNVSLDPRAWQGSRRNFLPKGAPTNTGEQGDGTVLIDRYLFGKIGASGDHIKGGKYSGKGNKKPESGISHYYKKVNDESATKAKGISTKNVSSKKAATDKEKSRKFENGIAKVPTTKTKNLLSTADHIALKDPKKGPKHENIGSYFDLNSEHGARRTPSPSPIPTRIYTGFPDFPHTLSPTFRMEAVTMPQWQTDDVSAVTETHTHYSESSFLPLFLPTNRPTTNIPSTRPTIALSSQGPSIDNQFRSVPSNSPTYPNPINHSPGPLSQPLNKSLSNAPGRSDSAYNDNSSLEELTAHIFTLQLNIAVKSHAAEVQNSGTEPLRKKQSSEDRDENFEFTQAVLQVLAYTIQSSLGYEVIVNQRRSLLGFSLNRRAEISYKADKTLAELVHFTKLHHSAPVEKRHLVRLENNLEKAVAKTVTSSCCQEERDLPTFLVSFHIEYKVTDFAVSSYSSSFVSNITFSENQTNQMNRLQYLSGDAVQSSIFKTIERKIKDGTMLRSLQLYDKRILGVSGADSSSLSGIHTADDIAQASVSMDTQKGYQPLELHKLSIVQVAGGVLFIVALICVIGPIGLSIRRKHDMHLQHWKVDLCEGAEVNEFLDKSRGHARSTIIDFLQPSTNNSRDEGTMIISSEPLDSLVRGEHSSPSQNELYGIKEGTSSDVPRLGNNTMYI